MEYSGFSKCYKKVWKKYRHTFEEDYQRVITVIKRKIAIENGNHRYIPNSNQIQGLGKDIKLPIIKTRVQIKEARDNCGRLIYLVDNERKTLFLIDLYYKSDRENHDEKLIKEAYKEYLTRLFI